MYRTNAQSRAVEEALVRHRIPYRLIGGVRFYQRREIKRPRRLLPAGAEPTRRSEPAARHQRPRRAASATRRSNGCEEFARENDVTLWDACEGVARRAGRGRDRPVRRAAVAGFVHIVNRLQADSGRAAPGTARPGPHADRLREVPPGRRRRR